MILARGSRVARTPRASFLAGCAVWWIAADGFTAVYGEVLFWVRALQFVLLVPLAGFLLANDVGLTPASFGGLKTSPAETLEIVTTVQADLEKILEWNVTTIEEELRAISERMGKKLRVVTPPLFVAMSGSSRSLPLFDSMAILGRSVVRQRLKVAAQVVASMVGSGK